jgi:hypothetical protein
LAHTSYLNCAFFYWSAQHLCIIFYSHPSSERVRFFYCHVFLLWSTKKMPESTFNTKVLFTECSW